MKLNLRLVLPALAMLTSTMAFADGEQVPRATAPARAASSVAAPASAPFKRATPGNHQHQLLGKCSQKLDAAGIIGPARKKAMSDCLRAS